MSDNAAMSSISSSVMDGSPTTPTLARSPARESQRLWSALRNYTTTTRNSRWRGDRRDCLFGVRLVDLDRDITLLSYFPESTNHRVNVGLVELAGPG
jgi:hypothetical protein